MAIKIRGHVGLVKNKSNNAIINIDKVAYNNYINAKKIQAKKDKEVSNLRDEVKELKDIVKKLVKSKKK